MSYILAMDGYALGQRAAWRAFALTEKQAMNRFSKFLRTAPITKIGPAVEGAFGSAQPTHIKDFETNGLLKSLRGGADVDREKLVGAVRQRLRSGHDEHELFRQQLAPRDAAFAKSFQERINSAPVKFLHGGTEPELNSILTYGPNGAIPMAPGAAGKNELGGLFVHKPTDPLASRAMEAYGQTRASRAGGSPAVLEGEIPEGLLSEKGRIGGGEHVLPASLWKYVRNSKVRKT